MENIKVFTFYSQSPYEAPYINPVLKTYDRYTYFVPNNKDGEIYQTFKEIERLYDNCPLHSTILNSLIQEVYGTGLSADGLDAKIIRRGDINKLLLKVVFDFVLYGGSYVEVIWNDEHTKILEIKHIPYSQIRLGNFNKDQEIDIFFHCVDWTSWKKKTITPLVRFN